MGCSFIEREGVNRTHSADLNGGFALDTMSANGAARAFIRSVCTSQRNQGSLVPLRMTKAACLNDFVRLGGNLIV